MYSSFGIQTSLHHRLPYLAFRTHDDDRDGRMGQTIPGNRLSSLQGNIRNQEITYFDTLPMPPNVAPSNSDALETSGTDDKRVWTIECDETVNAVCHLPSL